MMKDGWRIGGGTENVQKSREFVPELWFSMGCLSVGELEARSDRGTREREI